jgi:glutamate synthase (NADPH/NADH) large chain
MAAERANTGLYDPRNEHDSCGVGFVVNIKGRKSHDIIQRGLQILVNLDHRGAVGADPLMGDGAGCMIQMPDQLRAITEERGIELPPGRYAVAMLSAGGGKARVAVQHFEHTSMPRASAARLARGRTTRPGSASRSSR